MKNISNSNINDLPHIDEIETLSEKDIECFKEVRDILIKYDFLNRFGISLLHKHFDVRSDEILVEETDEENRVQSIKPFLVSQLKDCEVISTAWRLSQDMDVIMGCYRSCCVPVGGGVHSVKHTYQGS